MALSSQRCAQLVSFVLALTCIPAHATVNQSMQDWFNEIGAYGNVTGPNAYRGQTMNMYTGGSLYMRTPVRNYQLASISPPSTMIPGMPPAATRRQPTMCGMRWNSAIV